MRVLNLGLDQKILDENSAVAQRARAYGDLVKDYLVVVPGQRTELKLSDKVTVQGIGGSNKLFILFKIYKYLNNKLTHNRYDIITIQDVYYLAWLGTLLAKKFHLKIEIQIHGWEKFKGLRKKIARYNLHRADKIRTVSQRMKQQLIDDFDLQPEKIYVAPVAIDKHSLLADNSSVNLKQRYPGDFIFLTVGRLVPIKNVALQIGCLAGFDPSWPIRLIIVGDGPDKARLIALADNLKVRDKIEFVNWTDNLSAYYKTADCLLLTSDSEGYGMVVAEAVLADLPVIMTDVGVAGELVQDGLNGLVIPVDNASALSRSIEKVLTNPELLSKFSANAKSRHDKILDQSALVNLVVDNWRKIINV